jgi:hypothetical protein
MFEKGSAHDERGEKFGSNEQKGWGSFFSARDFLTQHQDPGQLRDMMRVSGVDSVIGAFILDCVIFRDQFQVQIGQPTPEQLDAADLFVYYFFDENATFESILSSKQFGEKFETQEDVLTAIKTILQLLWDGSPEKTKKAYPFAELIIVKKDLLKLGAKVRRHINAKWNLKKIAEAGDTDFGTLGLLTSTSFGDELNKAEKAYSERRLGLQAATRQLIRDLQNASTKEEIQPLFDSNRMSYNFYRMYSQPEKGSERLLVPIQEMLHSLRISLSRKERSELRRVLESSQIAVGGGRLSIGKTPKRMRTFVSAKQEQEALKIISAFGQKKLAEKKPDDKKRR